MFVDLYCNFEITMRLHTSKTEKINPVNLSLSLLATQPINIMN